MNLLDVYNLVDYDTKMSIISDLLKRDFDLFNKAQSCESIAIESVNDFSKIEQFLVQKHEMEPIRDDCILMSKDLLAYLKTVYLPDGNYIITKYYLPILEIKIGKPGIIVDTIEITDYIKKLQYHESIWNKVYNWFF